MLINKPPTAFKTFADAEKVVHDLDPTEYRIDVDPKGSGRCLVMILDEETGEQLGYL